MGTQMDREAKPDEILTLLAKAEERLQVVEASYMSCLWATCEDNLTCPAASSKVPPEEGNRGLQDRLLIVLK